jgi:hypothetical protein
MLRLHSGRWRVEMVPRTVRLNRFDKRILRQHCGMAYTETGRGTAEMTVVGCARSSSADPDLSIQGAALRAAGCDVIGAEKRDSTGAPGRYKMRIPRSKDLLPGTRFDRLARISDLHALRICRASVYRVLETGR